MSKILRWTNKFSGEQGYVMSVKAADGHFINTFTAAEAKTFARQCDVTRTLHVLEKIGETENNVFEALEA